MEIQSRTIVIVENVSLSESEKQILAKAQRIIDLIYLSLCDVEGEIPTNSNAERIYAATEAIGDCLDIIANEAIIKED